MNRLKKVSKFLSIMLAFIIGFTQLTPLSVALAADKVNVDFTVSNTLNTSGAEITTYKSGSTIDYVLDLKVSGANEDINTEVGASTLTVQLPLAVKEYFKLASTVDELAINSVVPVYDEAAGTLTYNFPAINTGFSARTVLSLKTENGITPNNTQFPVTGTFKYQTGELTDDATATTTAALSSGIKKEFVQFTDDPLKVAGRPGDEVIFKLTANSAIPTDNNLGSLYLEPSSLIKVTDVLNADFTYVASGTSLDNLTADGGGLSLTQTGQTLVWQFEAPTLDEQKQATDLLFNKEIYLKVKISDQITQDKLIPNEASLSTLGIGGNVSETVNKASVNISVTVLIPGAPQPIGSNYPVRYTYGPRGEQGDPNPNRGVEPDQAVGFLDVYFAGASNNERIVNEATGQETVLDVSKVVNEGYQKIEAIYTVDEMLQFRSIHTYLPVAYSHTDGDKVYKKPLEKYPTVTAEFTLKDGTVKTHVFDFSGAEKSFAPKIDVKTGTDLAWEALGLAKDDIVTQVKITYVNEDGSIMNGAFTTQSALRYDILPEAQTGERLEQKVEYVVTLADGTVLRRGPQATADTQYDGTTAVRFDTLVVPQVVSPTVQQSAVFLNTTDTRVTAGTNRVQTFLSLYGSSSELSENPHSVVVLPLGVKLDPNHANTDVFYLRSQRAFTYNEPLDPGTITVLTDNYQGSDRQAILVEWNREVLRRSERLVAEFDVVIDAAAPESLTIDSYGFGKSLTDKFLLRDAASPIVSETVDINEDGVTGRDIATHTITYSKTTTNDVLVEKFVKGSLDQDYSKFAYTEAGKNIDYKLTMTNTTGNNIYSLGFLDILPGVGDLEVINNEPRLSAFTPTLTGPIVIPAQWQDKVVVKYSTEINPSRQTEIYNKVKYYPEDYVHVDAPNAVAATWLTEAEVTDWSTIRSFSISLGRGDIWVQGQSLDLTFTMKAPEGVDEAWVLIEKDPALTASEELPRDLNEDKAAWNSFAVTTNRILPTEPERVGVVVVKKIGDVVIKYVDTEGNEIQVPTTDELDQLVGTSYDTTNEGDKPSEITFNGSKYVLVPRLTQGSETGEVVEGLTEVTYVYQKVANWIPQLPDVPETDYPEIPYPFDPTNPDKPVDPTTPGTSIPYVPGYVPVDPNTNEPLKPVDPTDPNKGYIPPTPENPGVDTLIPYVPTGDVIVNYVDTEGNVIKVPVTDTKGAKVGTKYDTTDNKPKEITYNGSKYVLVPRLTEGSETGEVVKGVTEVTYVYQKVANWIPQIPGVPETEYPEVPYPFDPTNPDKPVDPTTPGTSIPYVPGYVPVDPNTNEPLKPVDPEDPTKGYIPPTPENPGVDTPIPYVQAGDVVVEYVDTEGNVIKVPVTDTKGAKVGTSYDTTDNKPVEIVTEDGTRYVLVPSLTKGNETGNVVSGTTTITYVYKKVANWIPLIPGVPTNELPNLPYPFDPTNPDQPITPNPGTVIPHIPGYVPVDPNTNEPLKPVDPTDPSKGYIPPTPENPGVDTLIPYVPVPKPTPEVPNKGTDNPKTGDEFSFAIYGMSLLASAAGVLFVGKKRRNK